VVWYAVGVFQLRLTEVKCLVFFATSYFFISYVWSDILRSFRKANIRENHDNVTDLLKTQPVRSAQSHCRITAAKETMISLKNVSLLDTIRY
jgi:hypothetical protein